MALENHIQIAENAGGVRTLQVTDMKKFGAELTKELSRFFNISENYEIPILTEEEYSQIVNADTFNYLTATSGTGWLPSLFSRNPEAAMILDKDKNDPYTYGEELAHGLRYFIYDKGHPGEKQPPVQEFFGWLGAKATFFILQRKLLPVAYNQADARTLWKGKKRFSAEYTQNEAALEICHADSTSNEPPIKKSVERGEYLQSEIQHCAGYAVAEIAYPVAKQDAKLFYRPDEEVWNIYFRPVFQYDWSKHSNNNPVWRNVRNKVLREIKEKLK